MTPATARRPASGSPFSQASLVAYTILIVYVSLYRFRAGSLIRSVLISIKLNNGRII